jgi:hypothetical protein
VTCELGPEVPRPEWVEPNAPFWGDLSALGKANPYGDSDQIHPSWIIAATRHSDLGFPKEEKQKGEFLGPHLAPTAPERRDAAWRFLGFDITDGAFISGLSDCGYSHEEHDGLAAEWACHLNRYHLFDNLGHAFKFRALTNTRVRAHAPFFVIGLWLLAKVPKR